MRMKLLFTNLLTGCVLLFSASLFADIAIKKGDCIAFLGDTVTVQGNILESGYVNLITTALRANGINTVTLSAAVRTSTAPHMLARLQKDVLNKKPRIMLLSCGVNDVRQGKQAAVLNRFKTDITAIVTRAQKAGIKVYILTSTMITENANFHFNRKLKSYNDFLRKLAKDKKCGLIDINQEMQKTIADVKKIYPGVRGNILTYDGIHMNPMGSIMMARCILKAFGLNEEQIAKGAQSWISRRYVVGDVINISVREYLLLSEKAFAARRDVLSFVHNAIHRELREK